MLEKMAKKLHLYGLWRRICFFCLNHVLQGTKPFACLLKRKLLGSIGCEVGEGTTIVSPVAIMGTVTIGKNCWINRGFTVHGNGAVRIGDACDIGPEVAFLTGGHQIGPSERRAGEGQSYCIAVEDGCWIGARSTILGNTIIRHGAVVAACACVTRDVEADTLVAGIPAKKLRGLDYAEGKAAIKE